MSKGKNKKKQEVEIDFFLLAFFPWRPLRLRAFA
jgi:hypothetical protein